MTNLYQALLEFKMHPTHFWPREYPRFFDQDVLELFAQNLTRLKEGRLEEHLSLPIFNEELIPERSSVFTKSRYFINELSKTEQILELCASFFDSVNVEEILVLLGMRFTPASLRTIEAIPPPKQDLLDNAFSAYNPEVSLATRAWAKHVGRSEDQFWGEIKGNSAEKEALAHQKLIGILNDATWWNTFVHYKHELVYEFRLASGHGARWKKEGLVFLGFLEPFLD